MDFTSAAWIWLYLGAFLMLAEIVSPGLVLFFFGLAAATVAGCVFLFPALSTAAQLALFSAFAIVYLVGLRRLVKSVFVGDVEQSGGLASAYVGRVGKVVEAIRPGVPGRVALGDAEWTAVADEALDAGREVRVVSQQNLTLTVAPAQMQ